LVVIPPLRIRRSTLSEIIKSFLSRRWRDIIWGYFLFFLLRKPLDKMGGG